MKTLLAYFKLARPDHWFKNILILPGILLAYLRFPTDGAELPTRILLGIITACAIASANYIINEWVDADYDRFHPVKKNRPSVLKQVSLLGVVLEYLFFLTVGILCAKYLGFPFLWTAVAFAVAGVIYNLQPFRTKDYPILDVLSESVNNPIRLLLGWFIIAPTTFPSSSFIVAYWMAGAYLMAVKRYSELRFMENREAFVLYRKSFAYYTEDRLLLMSFFFAISCAFFLGIFLIKNRIELLLSFPFLSVLFVWYLKIGMRPNSAAQHPELLFMETAFFLYLVFISALLIGLLLIDIPWIHWLLKEASNPDI